MASDSVPSLDVVGNTTSPRNHSSSLSHNILIAVTAFAVTVTVLFAIYFILRYRLRRSSSSSTVVSSSRNRISPETTSSNVDSLPLFAFSSITRKSTSDAAGDCAVCLSKFESQDLLRLLPLCCHAFHAECIDTWLQSNRSCPLCRSAVFVSESEQMKLLRPSSGNGSRSNSFRLEIGNVSSRRELPSDTATGETDQRSYSVGAFEYFVNEEAEIPFGNTHRIIVSGEKNDAPALEIPVVSQASLAGEVGRESSWLKDFSLSRLMSIRSSGRFFTGSSRRNDVVGIGNYDVEANGFGEEISEMFRWLSRV